MFKVSSHVSMFACASGVLLLAGCASLSSKPPRTANLSGEWKMDTVLSEDPQGAMRQLRQRPPGGMGGGGHRHGGGMSDGMGGMGGGMGMPSAGSSSRHGGYGAGRGSPTSAVLPVYLNQPADLSIKQTPQSLALNADGVPTTLVYGEKVVASVKGGTAERVSGWKGADFVVKYKMDDGAVATRSYETGDGRRQLIVTTALEGGRRPKFEYRTVYERTPAG